VSKLKKTLKKVLRKKQLIKNISSLEKELIGVRKILYHIYDGIEIFINNMGEINEDRFDWCFNFIGENIGMKLFKNWDEERYFKQILKGIGISKTTIEAYLHGFLKTYNLEQIENNLVNRLNDYNDKLKILTDKPFKYKCLKCNGIIEIKSEDRIEIVDCPLCQSKSYKLSQYKNLYQRDPTGKLTNKKRFDLSDLLNKGSD